MNDPYASAADHNEPLEFESTIDLMAVAWRRRSLIALATVAMLVVGALYYAQKAPVYESEAQVLVVQKRPDVVTSSAMHLSEFEDYVSTHRVLIQSPLIVENAVRANKLDRLKSFAQVDDDLIQHVIDGISVEQVSKDSGANPNSILQFAFRGPVPEECGLVVNAILDSYKQFLDETYRDLSGDTLNLITQARDVLQNDLTQLESQYWSFRQESPLLWKGSQDVNPLKDRLTMIENQRSSLLLRRAELESNLLTITQARDQKRSDEQLVAMVSDLIAQSDAETLTGKTALTLEQQLFPLLLEEKRLLEAYGPDHPDVQSVRARIEATRSFFALPSAAYSKAVDTTVKGRPADPTKLVEMYTDFLQHQLARLNTSEQLLAEMYQAEHAAARELTGFELKDEEFRRNIARTQGLYDGIVKQLQDISLVKDYGGFDARVITPAGLGEKVAPKAMLVFPLSIILGLMAGGGLAVLAEITDKSFRTPDEIRRQLGLPIIGHIPEIEPIGQNGEVEVPGAETIEPMVYTFHHRMSTAAEAYRGVRTALYFSGGGNNRVLQITSPKAGDGKSTLAANVAVSIAQSGKRTLLIDADLRKPRQHKLFGLAASVGLSSVIGLDAEPADAIHATAVPNLWVMPSGPIPPDPAELLTSPRLAELLGAIREQYDYVIVDTAPILVVTDPCAVAPRVDGVILTLQVSRHSRAEADRVKQVVGSIEAQFLGVVVNRVGSGDSKNYGYRVYGFGAEEYHVNGRKRRLRGSARRVASEPRRSESLS